MVSASKILTVSYGTFSCTLEGFDDPFSTMRSIAEYFRDLAADDRYFGAEPPQPDAEMLHRIAERELRRPVEARIEDNNVILRQREEGAIAGAVASEVAEQAALEGVKAEPSPAEPQPDAAVSAKPKRSKAEKKAARAAKQAKKARKKRQAEKAARRQAEKAAKAQQTAQDAQKAPEAEKPAQPARPARNEAPAQVAAQAEQPAKPRRKAKLSTDLSDASIAAKLQRIRAVVGHDGTDIDNEPGDSAPNNDFYAPIRDQSTEDSAPEAGLLDAQLGEDLLESGPEAGAEADDSLIARIADATEILEEDSNVLAQEDQGGADQADFAGENAFSEDENEQEVPQPVAIARVVKVRKAQAPEMKAPSPETAEPEIESTLSPEDEAALLAELAEVERDAPKAATEESNKGAVQPRTAFDDGGIAGADAIDRILAETDAKLMSDEASQRRASIAHLRAAVHAKRAENGGAGELTAGDSEAETYREDLAEAVQPHRPAASSDRSAHRLAPLVLVSEQRIDARKSSQDEAKAPVRPRRVHANAGSDPQARQAQNSDDPKAAFAAFAISKGAKGAEELLEAAAAFRVFVAGQETFSRPQVMGLVIRAEHGSSVSREEGLRAFGKLIRDGVIQKIQRGRYTISENTRFRPDQARASA